MRHPFDYLKDLFTRLPAAKNPRRSSSSPGDAGKAKRCDMNRVSIVYYPTDESSSASRLSRSAMDGLPAPSSTQRPDSGHFNIDLYGGGVGFISGHQPSPK